MHRSADSRHRQNRAGSPALAREHRASMTPWGTASRACRGPNHWFRQGLAVRGQNLGRGTGSWRASDFMTCLSQGIGQPEGRHGRSARIARARSPSWVAGFIEASISSRAADVSWSACSLIVCIEDRTGNLALFNSKHRQRLPTDATGWNRPDVDKAKIPIALSCPVRTYPDTPKP